MAINGHFGHFLQNKNHPNVWQKIFSGMQRCGARPLKPRPLSVPFLMSPSQQSKQGISSIIVGFENLLIIKIYRKRVLVFVSCRSTRGWQQICNSFLVWLAGWPRFSEAEPTWLWLPDPRFWILRTTITNQRTVWGSKGFHGKISAQNSLFSWHDPPGHRP